MNIENIYNPSVEVVVKGSKINLRKMKVKTGINKIFLIFFELNSIILISSLETTLSCPYVQAKSDYDNHQDLLKNLSFLHSYINVEPTFRSIFYFPEQTQIEVEITERYFYFFCGSKSNPDNVYNKIQYEFTGSLGNIMPEFELKYIPTPPFCVNFDKFREIETMFLLDYKAGSYALMHKCIHMDSTTWTKNVEYYVEGLMLLVSEELINEDIENILTPDYLRNSYYVKGPGKFPVKSIKRYRQNSSYISEKQCKRIKKQRSSCDNSKDDFETEFLIGGIFVGLILVFGLIAKLFYILSNFHSEDSC